MKDDLRKLNSALSEAENAADNPGPFYSPADYEDIIIGLQQRIQETKSDIQQAEAHRARLLATPTA